MPIEGHVQSQSYPPFQSYPTEKEGTHQHWTIGWKEESGRETKGTQLTERTQKNKGGDKLSEV